MYYDQLKRRARNAAILGAWKGRTREDVLDHIAEAYRPLWEDVLAGAHTRYNMPGGRGSAKSSFVSLAMVDGIMSDPEACGIVFRRYGVTLRDSVYSQVAWAIDELGVTDLWRGSVSPMQWTYKPTGQVIAFRGLDDSQKLKSIRPPAHGSYRWIWLEEFSELTGPNQVRSVLQSVMRGMGPFRVFASFNPPRSKANWANTAVLQVDSRAMTFRTTYLDVPEEWLGQEFIAEAEALKAINPTAYAHEYLGEAVGSGGEVFPQVQEVHLSNEDIHALVCGYVYCGLDFGFATDPAAFVRLAYDSRTRTITLLDEIVALGMTNEAMADAIKARGYDLAPHQRDYYSPFGGGITPTRQVVTCDSAEPKSILDLNNLGIKALGCTKWPGSVQYGVKWLQGRTIRIDPKRCPVAWKEFTTYEYCQTKDHEFTSDVPDKDNHVIDATRYALDRLINDKRESA